MKKKRPVMMVLLYVCLVFVLDFSIGKTLESLFKKTFAGERGGLINLALRQKPQILLLGSSRMKHHIVPAILQENLKMSVFNAGANGQDLLYVLMLMDLWRQNNPAPQVIVLHLEENSFLRRASELQLASVFSYFYGQSELVREVLSQKSLFEPIKHLSLAYRANGKVFSILSELFSTSDEKFDGFEGLPGKIDADLKNVAQAPGEKSQELPLDFPPFWDLKVKWFDSFIQYCRQNRIRLFLQCSPKFREDRLRHAVFVNTLAKFLKDYPDAEFIDISETTYPEMFHERADLFRDDLHLNASGAEIFSQALAQELHKRMIPR